MNESSWIDLLMLEMMVTFFLNLDCGLLCSPLYNEKVISYSRFLRNELPLQFSQLALELRLNVIKFFLMLEPTFLLELEDITRHRDPWLYH
jgi:hypothetical protein